MRLPFIDIRAQYMDLPHRRVLDLRPEGLKEIPVLGWYTHSEAKPEVPVHRHLLRQPVD